MNSLTLNPIQKQLFQVQPQVSHPRLSLSRVLWVKILRWLDKASVQAILKAVYRLAGLLLLAAAVVAPAFMAGLLTAICKWNAYRIPILLAVLTLTLNAKRLYLFLRRTKVKGRAANQHTFEGVPVSELADWLLEHRSFKRADTIDHWKLSQGQWQRIAEQLEKHGVLTRGENNARVLRDITRGQLVRQLAEDFPLAWSEERQMFYERNGTLERWAINQDFQRRKLDEKTERKERKLEKLEQKIEVANESLTPSSFAAVQALWA